MMKSFVSLLEPTEALSPAQQQQAAIETFRGLIEISHMSEWRPGRETTELHQEVLLIGVATYVGLDMSLLDVIEAKLRQGARDEAIYVFDTASYPELKDFEKYFPGIGQVYHTPVMGHWQNGILRETNSGFLARQWILKHLGITERF